MKTKINTQNAIIAEFMGWELKHNPNISQKTWNNKEKGYCKDKESTFIEYSNDWNWLMEVVEKIENYNEFTNVLFAPQGCTIDCYIKNGFSFSNDCDTKIEAVYNACVEFINWYHKQLN